MKWCEGLSEDASIDAVIERAQTTVCAIDGVEFNGNIKTLTTLAGLCKTLAEQFDIEKPVDYKAWQDILSEANYTKNDGQLAEDIRDTIGNATDHKTKMGKWNTKLKKPINAALKQAMHKGLIGAMEKASTYSKKQ